MSLRHDVAILFSERSRQRYIAEAIERGEIYPFVDAWGRPRRWVKGDYAYLAPVAAAAFLNRCAVKHDLVDEAALQADADAYHTILVPDAVELEPETVAALLAWLDDPGHRLLVTGPTNLPPDALGLASLEPDRPAGFTGWRWLPDSPFADAAHWEECYPSGARGYAATRVVAGRGARALAELCELSGDLSSAATATRRRLGDAVVLAGRTLYVANRVFELLGAAMQAHVELEAIRRWHDPLRWTDTLAFFLWAILRDWQPRLGALRLRPFGSHRGVLSLRHDVDKSADLAFVDFQDAYLVPATYHILDPVISDDATTREQAATWVRATTVNDFIEPGLHNDTVHLEHFVGAGLYEHVRASEANLGVAITNCGRHGSAHVNPETVDAMDYLYEHAPGVLGMCSFSFYRMIDYGLPRRDGPASDDLVAYATGDSPTIAIGGFWFPFHPVAPTVESYRILRGWDVTHEYDSDYDLVDAIYEDRHGKDPSPPPRAGPRVSRGASLRDVERAPPGADTLDNGVYTIQYHPLFARDPAFNRGLGTLPYLAYAVAQAERRDLWIANKTMLHRRLNDYQDVRFRVAPDGRIHLENPTDRRLEGLTLESATPVGTVTDGRRRYAHVVGRRFVTLPPLDPGQTVTLRLEDAPADHPLVRRPGTRGLRIVDAYQEDATATTVVELATIRSQVLLVANLAPGRAYRVTIRSDEAARELACVVLADATMAIELHGPRDRFARQRLEIVPLPDPTGAAAPG